MIHNHGHSSDHCDSPNMKECYIGHERILYRSLLHSVFTSYLPPNSVKSRLYHVFSFTDIDLFGPVYIYIYITPDRLKYVFAPVTASPGIIHFCSF